ncbi:MAG: hypothetical protein RL660_2790 [Bacteroidota bacterium]|jgi:uncharacterized membrane protein YeaQ/YmgE (transglycosylase-associated protein family)
MKKRILHILFILLDLFFKFYGWLRIVISPTLIAGFFAVMIYDFYPNQKGIIAGVIVGIIGLVIGIIWAEKVMKSKGGVSELLSKVDALSEMNTSDKEDE